MPITQDRMIALIRAAENCLDSRKGLADQVKLLQARLYTEDLSLEQIQSILETALISTQPDSICVGQILVEKAHFAKVYRANIRRQGYAQAHRVNSGTNPASAPKAEDILQPKQNWGKPPSLAQSEGQALHDSMLSHGVEVEFEADEGVSTLPDLTAPGGLLGGLKIGP